MIHASSKAETVVILFIARCQLSLSHDSFTFLESGKKATRKNFLINDNDDFSTTNSSVSERHNEREIFFRNKKK